MNLLYRMEANWPPLAWLARCKLGTETVFVTHGSNVEVTESWFCEAAWDGEFNEGGFDATDIVAGSGGRMRADLMVFVSAGNTVDRLVSIKLGEAILVSNSLACLAAEADLDFLLKHNWYAAFHSIVKGIEQYQHEIPSSRGNVMLTYFDNLIWNGKSLVRSEKPIIRRDFSSFERYYDFLTKTLHQVHHNGNSNHRQQPFKLLTTVSTGYDSPTVTAIAKEVDPGIEGFTFSKSFGSSDDDGSEIARHLNINLHSINADRWRNSVFSEVPHIAADCLAEEVQYTSAETILNARILLTGFHGDVVWSKNMEDASEQLVRGDQSGLSLTEYRLWANFLHCPIPFWGARQSADIIQLSNFETMSKWDVAGDYSRTICRRIVESAGVPREYFGRKKNAASSWLYSGDQFLTAQSMENYLQWFRHNRSRLVQGPFSRLASNHAADRILFKIFKSTQRTAGKLGSLGHSIKALDRLRKPFQWYATLDWANNSAPPWVLPLRRFMFPWAVEMAKKKYTVNDSNN